MHRPSRATAIMVGLMALSLTACSDDGSSAPTTTSTSAATPTTVGEDLGDGEHVGYIANLQELDDGSYSLLFDLAYLLTGDEATAAAAAAGIDLDTDLYVQNDNPRVRDIELAPTVVTTVVGEGDACCDSVEIPFGEFVQRVYAASDDDQTTSEGPLLRLTVDGGLVTRMDEVSLA